MNVPSKNRCCPGHKVLLELCASTIFQVNAPAQHNKPAHLGYDVQDFNVGFQISRKISRIDFWLLKILYDFNSDFSILRKISGKLYEILVSGGPWL